MGPEHKVVPRNRSHAKACKPPDGGQCSRHHSLTGTRGRSRSSSPASRLPPLPLPTAVRQVETSQEAPATPRWSPSKSRSPAREHHRQANRWTTGWTEANPGEPEAWTAHKLSQGWKAGHWSPDRQATHQHGTDQAWGKWGRQAGSWREGRSRSPSWQSKPLPTPPPPALPKANASATSKSPKHAVQSQNGGRPGAKGVLGKGNPKGLGPSSKGKDKNRD